ncbi:glycosyl hydrolase family 61 [Colletotrichum asianum]|uniref:lytic cellulose monooxygenase (C4-dehydrogenating) n=1 Tax=Colletotrichum asianum TaxID=702518 RepID=A0A8H3WPA4_9PEZI|nr:glycosyl hydrolase family 61 [Colletotrichum asianum]
MCVEIVVPLLWLTPTVSCHGAVTSYTIDGKVYPGYEGFAPATSPPTIQWQWAFKTYVTLRKTRDLAGTMKAGTIITSNWKQWTHAQGPVMVWLYDCGSDFKSCRGDKQTWFKIDQMGLWDSNLNSENWGIALVLKRSEQDTQ